MPMSLNSGSASGILQGSRYNRGAGTAGTGATHASTVDTGSVLRIETNKTNGIILYCQPETTVPSVNADVQVTLLTAQSTNRGGAFVAPRVGDKIVWLTSKGNSFYLGMSHQATSPHPFLGDTDVDATTGGTNTGGASMLMTGMRIPDQPLGTTSDDPLPIENAQVDGAPGTGFANVPGFDVLMDPKTNTFRSVGEITGNALPNDPYEPYDIPDSVFEKSSSGFKTVMQALNKVKDPAYAKAKGPGFNEISIRSRTAKVADPSGGNPTTNATEPESAPGSAAASGSFDTIGGQGGLTLVSQDNFIQTSSGDSSNAALKDCFSYTGKTLTIEAGDEIILQVGRSSITINQDGIAIAQSELTAFGSSFRLSNDSIEAFSISHDISAWTYDVSVPWATLNLSPMNAIIAACQGVEIKSGFQNFAPFGENLAEYVIQMATMAAGFADNTDPAQNLDIASSMADETIVATLGVPLNTPLLSSVINDEPLSVPPGFAALDIMAPVMGMIGAVFGEVAANKMGKGGSATVKLNNADVTIQGGYVEQIPAAVIKTLMTQDAIMLTAVVATSAAAAATPADSSAGLITSAVTAIVAVGLASAVTKSLAKEIVELPLLPAGNGNVRIEASQSMTSGAYLSTPQAASASPAQAKLITVNKILSGPLFPSISGSLSRSASAGYIKQLSKEGFAGVAGVGVHNSFLYHNLEIQTSSPMTHDVAVALDPANVVTMTEILLEGPSASTQHELHESAADRGANNKTETVTTTDDAGTATTTTKTRDANDVVVKKTATVTTTDDAGTATTTTKTRDANDVEVKKETTVTKPNGDSVTTTEEPLTGKTQEVKTKKLPNNTTETTKTTVDANGTQKEVVTETPTLKTTVTTTPQERPLQDPENEEPVVRTVTQSMRNGYEDGEPRITPAPAPAPAPEPEPAPVLPQVDEGEGDEGEGDDVEHDEGDDDH
jgi:hypothetical protein